MASISATTSPGFALDGFNQLQRTQEVPRPNGSGSLRELSAFDNITDDAPRLNAGNVQESIGRFLDVIA